MSTPTTHPAVLPSYELLARQWKKLGLENADLRAAVAKDAELLTYWADTLAGTRTRAGQAVRMRMRADELRKLLDPAARPTPGVPRGMRAAESKVLRTESQREPARAAPTSHF